MNLGLIVELGCSNCVSSTTHQSTRTLFGNLSKNRNMCIKNKNNDNQEELANV